MHVAHRKVRALDKDGQVDLAAARQVFDCGRPCVSDGGCRGCAPTLSRALSQLPPFSRPGTVRAASLATRSQSSVPGASLPSSAPRDAGRQASGRVAHTPASVGGGPSTRAFSRSFHNASSSALGAVPIRPGWISPAKRTPGMCRELAYTPSNCHTAFEALGLVGGVREHERGGSGTCREHPPLSSPARSPWKVVREKPAPVIAVKRAGEAPLVAGQRGQVADFDAQQVAGRGCNARSVDHPKGARQVVDLRPASGVCECV